MSSSTSSSSSSASDRRQGLVVGVVVLVSLVLVERRRPRAPGSRAARCRRAPRGGPARAAPHARAAREPSPPRSAREAAPPRAARPAHAPARPAPAAAPARAAPASPPPRAAPVGSAGWPRPACGSAGVVRAAGSASGAPPRRARPAAPLTGACSAAGGSTIAVSSSAHGGRFGYRSIALLAVEERRVVAGVGRDFAILGLLRDLAPGGTERLFLLALDLLLGHSVLALQLEMLPDGIVEYAHRAEPYRGGEDGSGTSARARSTRFLPVRFAR